MASGAVSSTMSSLRWDLLDSQPPSEKRLNTRLAAPGVRDDVFIAIDRTKRRYTLVEIPAGEPHDLVERSSRGIEVRTSEGTIGGGQLTFFVEVACLEPGGHAALDVVVGELIQALNAGASIGRVRLVQNVLAKWRQFWGGVNQGLLSKEQQLGLFGELVFLSRWLSPAVSPAKAVQLWRGPAGGRNDFETPGLGIEVKTTGKLDAAHVIHGLEQLLEPAGGALFLFCLSVRDELSGTETLPRLVQEARTHLAEDFDALSQLDSMLYSYGYDDRDVLEYAKTALRIRSEGLYRVQPGFPRLVPGLITGGLPAGVSGVNYEIRLDAAAQWLVAAVPAAAKVLLVDFVNR